MLQRADKRVEINNKGRLLIKYVQAENNYLILQMCKVTSTFVFPYTYSFIFLSRIREVRVDVHSRIDHYYIHNCGRRCDAEIIQSIHGAPSRARALLPIDKLAMFANTIIAGGLWLMLPTAVPEPVWFIGGAALALAKIVVTPLDPTFPLTCRCNDASSLPVRHAPLCPGTPQLSLGYETRKRRKLSRIT